MLFNDLIQRLFQEMRKKLKVSMFDNKSQLKEEKSTKHTDLVQHGFECQVS